MRYLIVAFVIIMLSACENTRHSIGISGKPLATGSKFEDSVKFNYKIIFGRIRKGEGKIDD